VIRRITRPLGLLALLAGICIPGQSQSNPDLEKFFRQRIGLNGDEINDIRNGQPVAKTMPPRTPAEVFLFGAVYIQAAPESYFLYVRDLERLRKLPGYLALGIDRQPPQLSDLAGFSLDHEDIQALKNCKPGDCKIQLPASGMEEFQRSIDWSAPDVDDQVNEYLQKKALNRLLAYEREGNRALGVYNDKRQPFEVSRQFAYILSYNNALPEYLPDFYNYLLSYPQAKPANVADEFYWARVKFGLKPTLRMIHVVTRQGSAAEPVAYAVAEKQLYASHYFETALDLSFCIRGNDDSKAPGFYLVMIMGSEQAGLTGPKGSIVRKAAVGRSVSNLRDVLSRIRKALEKNQ